MLLKLLQIHTPMFIRKKILCELTALTAGAFQCKAPQLKGLSCEKCLLEYARFTNEQAQKLIRNGYGVEEAKDRLYQAALQMGRTIRRRFHIEKPNDVMAASRLMYRILGIEMREEIGGIIIDRCFFSQYYNCDVCRVISSLDEGVAAGLSGGGRLEFLQRLTEGKNCCKARFDIWEERL